MGKSQIFYSWKKFQSGWGENPGIPIFFWRKIPNSEVFLEKNPKIPMFFCRVFPGFSPITGFSGMNPVGIPKFPPFSGLNPTGVPEFSGVSPTEFPDFPHFLIDEGEFIGFSRINPPDFPHLLPVDGHQFHRAVVGGRNHLGQGGFLGTGFLGENRGRIPLKSQFYPVKFPFLIPLKSQLYPVKIPFFIPLKSHFSSRQNPIFYPFKILLFVPLKSLIYTFSVPPFIL